MPAERKPMRYGHTEGHTDVCFDHTGKHIVTCGSDGDVRIWESLDDDDPKSINVGEKAYSMALKDGRLVTAVSNNTVQIHTFPEGAPDGILTRFTTNANHVVFSESGTHVAAGSSDFMVKVIKVSDSSQQKTLRGHDAPVLSVAIDPKDVYLASSSCDGSVAVWKISEQTQVISWNVLQKSSDVSNAKSICRLTWQPSNGKLLAVPVDKAVQLYERDSWNNVFNLSDDFITQPVNVVSWSSCGKFLAAGSVGGFMTVWNVETKECLERAKHEKGYTVCGLVWHPNGSQIAYTDTEGCLGLLDGLSPGAAKTSTTAAAAAVGKEAKDYDDLFDGDDDGLLEEDPSETRSPPKHPLLDDEDEDDLMPPLSRPRKRGAILEDDNSLDVGSLKLGVGKDAEDDDSASMVQLAPESSALRPAYEGPLPTPRQKPFQTSSTPVHLMHRFLVWNSVGIVRCYNDEQDNAIDVEFHDTSVHHSMHLTNSLGHMLADLSQEAVLLACEGTDELASKLQCLHFSSWDTNKEWMVDMPKEEDVQALCLGQGWAAAATSALLVRIFSMGGVQREIFSLPGPVVCMSAHGEQLMIVYHRGTGFDGDQSLGVQLLQFGMRRRQILHGDPLPLSKKSHLAWLGFSAEGTPCYVDSEGVVYMLNRSLGNTWTPVCNTREHCKGKSDHYWVVGIHENPQQLRCIPCKGARFPPTLPRPAIAILPFKLPYCQITTEKGQMEEQFWRSMLFHNHFDFLDASGYEFDEAGKSLVQKEQQELLMKMFALSCKLEREFRCVELAELMTQSVVTLAIRYASRSKRMALAQRLNELALEKAAEITAQQQEEEEQEDFRSRLNAGYSRTDSEWSQPRDRNQRRQQQPREEEVEEKEEEEEEDAAVEEETPECEMMEADEVPETKKQRLNPFGKGTSSPEKPAPKPVLMATKEGRVNPFKVAGAVKSPGFTAGQPRTANILDNMAKSSKKPSAPGSQAASKQKSPVLKPLLPKPKSKTQATLFQIGPKTASKKTEEKPSKEEKESRVQSENPIHAAAENTENRKPKTGFQLWLEENRKGILADHPDLDEAEIIKEGMGRFRALSAKDRLSLTEKAKGGAVGDCAEVKKRKRFEGEDGEVPVNETVEGEANSSKKKKPLGTSSKLSAFAFSKD
ncbi:WD repeat and HMG-box DNA-binding protein 1-like [Acipenser ruthenus]|uniref:WD repeat and HMG-box DNA-binding protein 1-like n=1 Tax=Acipenser ruthenus TaxID=7906 RepID=UPI00145A9DD7|nr:WD repeat and HMG-box DNA-binding protein 1-like [Acipenser ruthenus]XP_058843894.1 WD repeat and HMG-box DNA-binding protein 1-like [Acipenser ruthenus]